MAEYEIVNSKPHFEKIIKWVSDYPDIFKITKTTDGDIETTIIDTDEKILKIFSAKSLEYVTKRILLKYDKKNSIKI